MGQRKGDGAKETEKSLSLVRRMGQETVINVCGLNAVGLFLLWFQVFWEDLTMPNGYFLSYKTKLRQKVISSALYF